jgi:RNA recognition motif-containing protein
MTGRPRGFGFVEMETGADAAKAVSMLNGRTIDDREIKVNEAKPQESRSGSSGGNRSFGRSRGY